MKDRGLEMLGFLGFGWSNIWRSLQLMMVCAACKGLEGWKCMHGTSLFQLAELEMRCQRYGGLH